MDQHLRAFRVTGFIRELVPSVKVSRGELDDGTPVYIKEYRSHDIGTASGELLSEAVRLSQMSSEHVVQRFGHKIILSDHEASFQFALEWMDRSLEKAIASKTEPWKEEELWEALRALVDLLAMGQELGFAHRNVNPKTIFVTASGQLKLGEFECSMMLPDRHTFPLEARFNHMAPEVQETYIAVRRTEQPEAPTYNVFKGDVYSLGLTLLQMAKQGTFGSAPQSEVDGLPYSRELCGFLRLMLQANPERRPDFLSLRKTLYEVRPTLYRPSSRSTADSALSYRVSEILSKKASFEELWLAEMNDDDKTADSLGKLLAFGRRVVVSAGLGLLCHTCRLIFQVDVLGAFEVNDLLYCPACLRA